MDEVSKWCQACAKVGVRSRRRLYQLNLDEALRLCENDQCMDLQGSADYKELLVPRKASSVAKRIKNKLKPGSLTDGLPNGNTLREDIYSPAGSGHSPLSTFSVTSSNTDLEFEDLLNTLQLDMSDANELQCSAQSAALLNAVDILQSQLDESVNNALAGQRATDDNPPVDDNSLSFDVPPTNPATGLILIDNVRDLNNTATTAEYCTPVGRTELLTVSSENVIPNVNVFNQVATSGCGVTNKVMTYPQWENKDAMCWLDVTLNFLVHNKTLQRKVRKDSVLRSLFDTYEAAVEQTTLLSSQPTLVTLILNPSIGGSVTIQAIGVDPRRQEISKLLEGVREEWFGILQSKLRCHRGQEESPVFAIPHFLQEEDIMKYFLSHYQLEFKCETCSFHETRSVQKVVLTLPRVPCNFSVPNASILASCMQCGSPNQQRKVKFERLPVCVIMHFVEGLPSADIASYDFEFCGFKYNVTCVIQYTNNPNHFVAWIRDLNEGKWMECNDLKPGSAAFSESQPAIHESECHVVVWECEKLLGSELHEASVVTAAMSNSLEASGLPIGKNSMEAAALSDHKYWGCSSILPDNQETVESSKASMISLNHGSSKTDEINLSNMSSEASKVSTDVTDLISDNTSSLSSLNSTNRCTGTESYGVVTPIHAISLNRDSGTDITDLISDNTSSLSSLNFTNKCTRTESYGVATPIHVISLNRDSGTDLNKQNSAPSSSTECSNSDPVHCTRVSEPNASAKCVHVSQMQEIRTSKNCNLDLKRSTLSTVGEVNYPLKQNVLSTVSLQPKQMVPTVVNIGKPVSNVVPVEEKQQSDVFDTVQDYFLVIVPSKSADGCTRMIDTDTPRAIQFLQTHGPSVKTLIFPGYTSGTKTKSESAVEFGSKVVTGTTLHDALLLFNSGHIGASVQERVPATVINGIKQTGTMVQECVSNGSSTSTNARKSKCNNSLPKRRKTADQKDDANWIQTPTTALRRVDQFDTWKFDKAKVTRAKTTRPRGLSGRGRRRTGSKPIASYEMRNANSLTIDPSDGCSLSGSTVNTTIHRKFESLVHLSKMKPIPVVPDKQPEPEQSFLPNEHDAQALNFLSDWSSGSSQYKAYPGRGSTKSPV